jgi:outer membrane protein, heavy metal efflux system
MFVVFTVSLLFMQGMTHPTSTLELRDAYRQAEQRNPRIAAARALSDVARARTASARRPPDPQVQFGLMNYALPEWKPMDVLGMTQFQVMQMLPLGGKLGLAGRVADLGAAAESERSAGIAWDVRAKVAMAFYDLYLVERSLEIDRETVRLLQDVLRVAESMYRVGEGRQADVLRAQVEVARMAQDTIRMSSMRTAMAARLGALLDTAPVAESALLPVFPDTVPPLIALTGSTLLARPMLRAAQRDVEAADTRATLTRREIWPDITIGFQYGRREEMGRTENMGSVMIGAALPVFARSRQLRMRDEAAAMQQMARADLNAMRAETNAAIAEAHANLVRARTLARTYGSTLLPQAEASTESALSSYRVGRVDFMTLLDNRMAVNRYRKELAALEADEGKAWAELEMLSGRELYGSASNAVIARAVRREP